MLPVLKNDSNSSGICLSLNNVSCERGARQLFQGLSLVLNSGESIRLTGSNGSGKTTLLRVIAGLSQRFEGDISWRGESAHGFNSSLHQELLYFGHAPGVNGSLTPLENLDWWQRLHLNNPLTELDLVKALDQVQLKAYIDTPSHYMSAGQQRRVALARLFISPHRFWILDEPFTAIDHFGVVNLERCMELHLQRGGMLILTTHQSISNVQLNARMRTLDLSNFHQEANVKQDSQMVTGENI